MTMNDQVAIMIPEGWKKTTLGEVARINDLSIDRNYPFNEIEYIDVASVEERRLLQTQKIKLEGAPSRARRIVQDNSILISTVRPNLKHYCFIRKAKQNLIASTGFAVIRAEEGKSDPYFLYNLLTTKEYTAFLIKIADSQTSTYPAFNPSTIVKSKFILPSFPEQCAIAKVLSSLDDKIELLQAQNKTLENIAQALFKHWFIDFEFPDKDGKPYKSSGGKMVESELGEIPSGWTVKTIEQVTIKVTKGTTPTTIGGSFSDSGINFIKAESITTDHFFDLKKFSYIDTTTNQLLSRSVVCEGDLLYSIAGTIGRFAIVPKSVLPANTNQAVAIIRSNMEFVDPFYLQCTLSLRSVRERLFGNIVEAVQANLSLTSLKESKIIVPDMKGSDLFKAKIRILFNKIVINKAEIQTLSKIRDTILPKLMKGEIRVKGLQ